jgi:SAM-dependent methyltransferase
MIDPNARPEKHYTLDVGCGNGSFSYVLSQNSITVGMDVQKYFIKLPRKRREIVDFVVADIRAPPFIDNSFDMINCASILEHFVELEPIVWKLKKLLKKPGILLAAYPVETILFRTIWRIVSPKEFKFIDQTRTYFIDPGTNNMECYWTHPGTHKQTYLKIREVLKEHFRLVEQVKLPFRFLPDLMSYYECLKLRSD